MRRGKQVCGTDRIETEAKLPGLAKVVELRALPNLAEVAEVMWREHCIVVEVHGRTLPRSHQSC
jgi:hypothetical protein